MSYYPTNFYSNYPQPQQSIYGYNQTQLPNYQMSQPQMTTSQSNQIPGKIVDSQEVARVSDIPFGGYGIFPKADLSEVYVKMWNNNGTTSLVCFKPVVEGKVVNNDNEREERRYHEDSNISSHEECNKLHEQLLEKMNQLEEKINMMQRNNNSNNSNQEKMQIIKRKE